MPLIPLPKCFIWCWSEQKNDYAPTCHPAFNSPSEANAYGKANIKSVEFIVRNVRN